MGSPLSTLCRCGLLRAGPTVRLASGIHWLGDPIPRAPEGSPGTHGSHCWSLCAFSRTELRSRACQLALSAFVLGCRVQPVPCNLRQSLNHSRLAGLNQNRPGLPMAKMRSSGRACLEGQVTRKSAVGPSFTRPTCGGLPDSPRRGNHIWTPTHT
jgi:hypothetical protein